MWPTGLRRVAAGQDRWARGRQLPERGAHVQDVLFLVSFEGSTCPLATRCCLWAYRDSQNTAGFAGLFTVSTTLAICCGVSTRKNWPRGRVPSCWCRGTGTRTLLTGHSVRWLWQGAKPQSVRGDVVILFVMSPLASKSLAWFSIKRARG